MKRLDFNRKKSKLLKEKRGVSFEEIIDKIEKNDFIEIIKHHNNKKYPKQKMFLVQIENYIFAVPFVEDKKNLFENDLSK